MQKWPQKAENSLQPYSKILLNKSSAVAKMVDRGHNRHGPKREGAVPLSRGGKGRGAVSPSNTIWSGIRYPPFPQIDIIGAVVIVWRVRGKIIRYVMCNIVCNNCAQCDAHTL